MKKTIAAVLLLLLLTAASCQKAGQTDAAETSAAPDITETAADTAAAEEDEFADNLPEMDFEGYDFTVFMRSDPIFVADMYAEELNGDVLNDAVYDRNTKVSERFNFNYRVVLSQSAPGNDASQLILAGEDAYDIIICHARTILNYSRDGLLLDWNEHLPYVDLDRAWWNQDSRSSLSVSGRLYTCSGDISYKNLGSSTAMFFNKTIVADLGITDLYETVDRGAWTLDVLEKYMKDSCRDLDGDSVYDIKTDRLGYISQWWVGPIQVLYSGGQRICRKDGDDRLILTLNTERTASVYERYFRLVGTAGAYLQRADGNPELVKAFTEGRAMFFDYNLNVLDSLRDMKDDYGIIPWPKFDETEEQYYSNVDAGTNLIGVPVTAADPERTSVIIEALCAEGSRNVIPKYYEVVLKVKFSRDNESVKMFDLIRNSRVFDAGYFYSLGTPLASTGKELAADPNSNFASFYAKNEEKTLAAIEALNEKGE